MIKKAKKHPKTTAVLSAVLILFGAFTGVHIPEPVKAVFLSEVAEAINE